MVNSSIQAEAEKRRARVLALRRSGLKLHEIAEQMGISTTRASQLVTDALRRQACAPPPPPPQITPNLKLDRLPISGRARKALAFAGYQIVGDLVREDRRALARKLLQVPNCNRRAWDEIEAVLNKVEPGAP